MRAGLFDRRDLAAGDHPDAVLLHLGAQVLAHVVVKAAQDVVAAIDERHMRAEPGKNAGELDRDVAAALDHNAARQLRQMKRLVRGDGMLEARESVADSSACRRCRSGCRPRARARRSPICTVCASTSAARLLTTLTPAFSKRRACRPLRAARSRGPCWRSASASRTTRAATVQPKPAASSNSPRKREA